MSLWRGNVLPEVILLGTPISNLVRLRIDVVSVKTTFDDNFEAYHLLRKNYPFRLCGRVGLSLLPMVVRFTSIAIGSFSQPIDAS